MTPFVWIFNGENSRFSSGVFSSRETAESWIRRNRLSGVLTKYPVDTAVYDWAIPEGVFHFGSLKSSGALTLVPESHE